MTHHDDHDHHHKDEEFTMTIAEKAVKMLEHWIRHNDDHANTYREWADKLKKQDWAEAAALIDEAAAISSKVNEKFQRAAALIRKNA